MLYKKPYIISGRRYILLTISQGRLQAVETAAGDPKRAGLWELIRPAIRKAGLRHMTRPHGGPLIIPAEKRCNPIGPRVIKYIPATDMAWLRRTGGGDN